ncbi:GroES-like protein [Aspergillus japonicus CBS 114.51]|uniref:GroES-like protein n=1 Tax=Aspergillus japonicus CBS 114.51 TaxID=1448312 RepID=A0A8T8WWB0_ASPJA|nr:GroES-like protein [Aspergillus japonicus CBS 114.51]RAH80103.1 GroES-like protein [Aspergillus japonicus CBS 114.51]
MNYTSLLPTTTALMRGVVWTGTPFNVSVVDLPVPLLQSATDAIVRVSVAGICGTDLHTYRGHYGSATVPWAMGHEALGLITDLGDAVSNFRVGDRVVISDTVHNVPVVTESSTSFPFGMGPDRGNLGGCQSEYVRVPFAEQNLIPIPSNTSSPSDSDIDYLFLSDIFATGWGALDLAGFEPGDTVAVFGAGPVGLLSAYSAVLRGASKVYVVDYVPERLELARSIGAVPVNFLISDPVEHILAQEPNGVIRSVDCVGFEAVNKTLQMESDIIIRQMVNVTARNGGIGGVGIYADVHNSTGVPRGSSVMKDISFPVGTFFSKSLQYKVGAIYPPDYATTLLPLINSGLAKPGFVISSLVSIEDAPQAYARYNEHQEIKVVIRFEWS